MKTSTLPEKVKPAKNAIRNWATNGCALLIILWFAMVIFSPGVMRPRGSREYTSCLEALNSIKTGEEMFFTDNGQYTQLPDKLAMYMIAGCEKPDGSDCPGEVKKHIEKSCAERSFSISGTAKRYELRGVARDKHGCKICVTKKGYAPARYDKNLCQVFTCL